MLYLTYTLLFFFSSLVSRHFWFSPISRHFSFSPVSSATKKRQPAKRVRLKTVTDAGP